MGNLAEVYREVERVLEEAPQGLREDREVILAAVNQHGYALQFGGGPEGGQGGGAGGRNCRTGALWRMRRGVKEAVNQWCGGGPEGGRDCSAVCGGGLKEDREVVRAAVNQHGRALEYAGGA